MTAVKAAWITTCLALTMAGACSGAPEVTDTFTWNGTARTGNATINNAPTETGNKTWSVAAGRAVFGGSAGSGNGTLVIPNTSVSNTAVVVKNLSPGEVYAVVAEGDFTPGNVNGTITGSLAVGMQDGNSTVNLLQNQTLDRIYAKLDQSGNVTLNARVGGLIRSASAAISPSTSQRHVKMTLGVDHDSLNATLTVLVNNAEEKILTLDGTAFTTNPTWNAYAVNTLGTSTLLTLKTAGCYAATVFPYGYPINMGFKTLMSPANAPNDAFDTVANALKFAVHHGDRTKLQSIVAEGLAGNPPVRPLTIAMNPSTTDPAYNIPSGAGDSATANVFPGHWLYYAGTTLTGAVTSNATVIAVADTGAFDQTLDPVKNPSHKEHVVIYNRQGNGRPDWSSFEYAKVTKINTDGTVVVERGTSGRAAAKAFPAGAYIAAHVRAWEQDKETDENSVLFRINYSLDSDPDTDAGSLYKAPSPYVTANEWAAYWRAKAVMETGLDGAEHDVFYNGYAFAPRGIDADNDGIADWGYIDGRNSYNLGIQKYSKLLRNLITPDKFIQFDSITPLKGYRGWKYVNGVQMETFIDGARFSEAYEHLTHWVDKAGAWPRFSYGYCRKPTVLYHLPSDTPLPNSEFRKQFAVGLMVGMPHPYGSGKDFGIFDWDEQRGGTKNDYQWLGQALDAAKREICTNADGTPAPNLLGSPSWKVTLTAGYQAMSGNTTLTSNATFVPDGTNDLRVTGVPPDAVPKYEGVALQQVGSYQLDPAKEYTLSFDAMAEDSFVYRSETFSDMPLLIHITGHGGVQTSVLADKDWRHYTLSYPVTGAAGTCHVSFGVGETIGRMWIKNIILQEGTTDRLSREFEHGKVFLNMSKNDWIISSATRPDLLPANNTYQRLDGAVTRDVNYGGAVGTGITVPQNDAVFLIRP